LSCIIGSSIYFANDILYDWSLDDVIVDFVVPVDCFVHGIRKLDEVQQNSELDQTAHQQHDARPEGHHQVEYVLGEHTPHDVAHAVTLVRTPQTGHGDVVDVEFSRANVFGGVRSKNLLEGQLVGFIISTGIFGKCIPDRLEFVRVSI